MTSILGKTTSSQRWAAGAFGLALLFACSPKPTGEPAQPPPQEPKLTSAAPAAETPAPSPAATEPPGYTGAWAFADADCATPAKTFKLSGERIDMTPGERTCKVTNIAEEHPTGRSMIYIVKADCLTEGQTSQDTFRLNFGPSDTVMQLQLNARDPIRLMRCGA